MTGGGGAGGLDASVRATLGDLRLQVDLAVGAGQVVAVVGPNGAGKTTLLRALAGLVLLEEGHVAVDGAPVHHLPPEARPAAVVFQDLRLLPHLAALDDAAFGLRCRGASKRDARERAAAWLQRLGLPEAAWRRRPHQLSGGQAQRVALARALATEPRLLLLDEPMSAIDAGARDDLRRLLARTLEGFGGAAVLVTHDPLEAGALADRVVVLDDGRVAQEGTVAEVAAAPRSPWVASMLGLNLVRGRAAPGSFQPLDGPALTTASELDAADAWAVVPPTAIALAAEAPAGSARNRWATAVEGVDLEGRRVRVRLGAPLPLVAEVTAAAAAELRLREGTPVWASVKAVEVSVHAA